MTEDEAIEAAWSFVAAWQKRALLAKCRGDKRVAAMYAEQTTAEGRRVELLLVVRSKGEAA